MIERYEFGYSMFDEWAAVVLIDEAIVKNSLEHPTAVETGGLHSRGRRLLQGLILQVRLCHVTI